MYGKLLCTFLTHEKNLSSFLFFRCHANIFRHKNAFFKERLLLTKLKATLPTTEKRRKEKRFIEAAAVLRRRRLFGSLRTLYNVRYSWFAPKAPDGRRDGAFFHRIQSNVMSRRFMTTSSMRNCVCGRYVFTKKLKPKAL